MLHNECKISKQNEYLVDLVQFSEDLSTEWDRFVEKDALNSTFLHSRKFYNHNVLNREQDGSLIFLRKNKIVAVFPAVIYLENDNLILHSHLRATYGGIVIGSDVNVETANQIVEQIINYARGKGVSKIIIRNSFRIFHSQLCDVVDYAIWHNGFEIKSRELEVAVSLSNDVKLVKSRYHNDVFRNVKKAFRNLEIFEMQDLKEFWDILERCIYDKHGKRPVHDYWSIMRLIESVGKEKVLCFGAYHNYKLIAGCVVFVANDRVLHGQYIGADKDFQYLKPNHALIDHVIEYGCKGGFKYLNLGMANEDEGKILNYGLFSLKEHFGGRGVLRETMHLNII